MSGRRPRISTPKRDEPITIERLEAALAFVSKLILRDGPGAAPYFDRLEREIAALRASDDVVSRAKLYLESRAKDGAG